MATAKEVAQYIIKSFRERGDSVTNLKLQKLLYYVQGWHLGLFGKEAFTGDFKAWVHGPVNLDVYHAYKHNRWNPITDAIDDVQLPDKLEKHIDDVLEVYGDDSAWSLERRTHRETPWITARGGLPLDAECNAVITQQSMKEFFEQEAKDEEDQEN
jgi:uncharacterized phage-associated protein